MFPTTQSTILLSLKANQSDMISGFTHLTSTTSTVNINFNNYYTTPQTSNLVLLKSYQSDMVSGFTNLTSTTSTIHIFIIFIHKQIIYYH